MHQIYFYEDKNGESPLIEFIKKLNKNSKVDSKKINDYISLLEDKGLTLKEPYVKHLEDNIWELRPRRYRILFAVEGDGSFILLHQFFKTTNKTPKNEILKAKKEYADLKERFDG